MEILERSQSTISASSAPLKKVYGYVRISDPKQGLGVSEEVQHDAIERYARQKNLDIIAWYQETRTAGKTGRPKFNTMLADLRNSEACGFIFHKIDRSSRNLKDWNELMDLADHGIEIHFAHESLDLRERTGRLSADIQQIMASDYIRNLRQEAIKGLYGRLKQGIYPFGAPVGYINNGKGKFKTPHPTQAILVKKLFKLYASNKYSIQDLVPIVYKMGLRNNRGNKLSKNGVNSILNNPFYMGVMKVKDKSFEGKHKPLIEPWLYKKTEKIRTKRTNTKTQKFNFLFRRFIQCKSCQKSLIGEKRKGHIYYRCHTKECKTSLKEESIQSGFTAVLKTLSLRENEAKQFHQVFNSEYEKNILDQEEYKKSLNLQIAQVDSKLDRMIDAFLEGDIEKDLYERKKRKLCDEKAELKSKIVSVSQSSQMLHEQMEEFLGLLQNLMSTYDLGILEEKREILEIITSDAFAQGKKLYISIASPYLEIANQRDLHLCAPKRDGHRTVYTFNLSEPIAKVQAKKLCKKHVRIVLAPITQYFNKITSICK